MKARDRETLAEVETVRELPLHARVEMHLSTRGTSRLVLQPRQEGSSMATRPLAGIGHEIVNHQDTPAVQHFDESVSRHRANAPVGDDRGEPEAIYPHHAADSGEVRGGGDVGTQLEHDVARPDDVVIALHADDVGSRHISATAVRDGP